MLEDLALPPSAAEPARPTSLSRIDTTFSTENTPRLAPAIKGTPRLAPSNSTTTSPMIGATQSPALGPSGKKLEQKRSQTAKKRGSVSTVSALVSPAIRPKISPSIKPLLPEGGVLAKPNKRFFLRQSQTTLTCSKALAFLAFHILNPYPWA
ncbi:hypothetical protein KCU64_g23549, partial [Aureobasidium melanogenum]